MNQAREIAGVLQNYFRIIKTPHDGTVKAFLSRCQRATVRSGSNDYDYYCQGDGPTVVLVHGLHSHLGSLVPIAEALLKEGYQVVLFDAPAHGEAAGTTTTPPQVRQLIRTIGSQLGGLHAIICHSLGGVWALSSWGESFQAKTLISISSPATHRFLVTKFIALNQLRESLTEPLVQQLERRFGAALWNDYSPAEIVKQLTLPGLIIHGEDDDFVPPGHAAQIHANWAGSQLEMIPATGHFEIVESPAVMQRISAYLRQF